MNCFCGVIYVSKMPTEGQSTWIQKNIDGEDKSLPAKHFIEKEISSILKSRFIRIQNTSPIHMQAIHIHNYTILKTAP